MHYSPAECLPLYVILHYNIGIMKARAVQIRVTDGEKEGFELAASLAGISLSSWIRERLRLAAIRELESAGRKVPFVPNIRIPGVE